MQGEIDKFIETGRSNSSPRACISMLTRKTLRIHFLCFFLRMVGDVVMAHYTLKLKSIVKL